MILQTQFRRQELLKHFVLESGKDFEEENITKYVSRFETGNDKFLVDQLVCRLRYGYKLSYSLLFLLLCSINSKSR